MTYHPLLAVLLSIPLTVSPLWTVRADTLIDQAPLSTVSLTPSSTEATVTLPDSFIEPAPSIPTSTAATPTPVETTTSSVVTVQPTEEPLSSTMLCLAIIEPAPIQGPEWVALYGLTPSTTASLLDWSIADALGTVLKVSNTTPLLWDEGTQTARIELKSARLNNDGDTVAIKNPSGIVHDSFIYPGVEKGERWMRDSCTSMWRIFPERAVAPDPEPAQDIPVATTTITAIAEEVPPSDPSVVDEALPAPPVPESVSMVEAPPLIDSTLNPLPTDPVEAVLFEQPPEGVIDDAVAEAAELLDIAPVITNPAPVSAVIVSAPLIKAEPIMHPLPQTPVAEKSVPIKKISSTTVLKPIQPITVPVKKIAAVTAQKKSPAAKIPTKKTVTKKKVAAVKKVDSITSLSMSPLISDPESYQGIRVRIRGRVTSDKSILGAHRFVITNTDGRGLLIHATSKQVSPPLGALVDVTGKVVWNDEGLWIQQSTTDRWIPVLNDEEKGVAPNNHQPNLQAPSQEDAWSLLRVEGTITDVQRSSFDMEVDGASVHVRVSNLLGYRVGRLQKNDRVNVAGLLDLRSDDPTIVPQGADAIIIAERAKVVATVSQAPVSRPWLPVGAAASTLGLSEGWRRLRDRQKRRREEASFQAHKAAYQIQN